jgi:hypothetical protein
MNTTTLPTENPTLTAGMTAYVVKGCASRGVHKGQAVQIQRIIPMGPDYSHAVMVAFTDSRGRKLVFYARHPNRLADDIINLNDGNPLHVLKLSRRRT